MPFGSRSCTTNLSSEHLKRARVENQEDRRNIFIPNAESSVVVLSRKMIHANKFVFANSYSMFFT